MLIEGWTDKFSSEHVSVHSFACTCEKFTHVDLGIRKIRDRITRCLQKKRLLGEKTGYEKI
jgi:hypothetical protein